MNDLDWYLTRFVDEALVQEPSVSDEEWLSRELATQLRNSAVGPDETDEFCKIYGVERADPASAPGAPAASAAGANTESEGEHGSEEESGGESDERGDAATRTGGGQARTETQQTETTTEPTTPTPRRRLVEPLYVRRTGGDLPEYDLRDVDSTLVVRITEAEHSP